MMLVRISIRARSTKLCDKVCQWLATGRWFSQGTPVSSTNKADHHDIAEILFKVKTLTLTPFQFKSNFSTSISFLTDLRVTFGLVHTCFTVSFTNMVNLTVNHIWIWIFFFGVILTFNNIPCGVTTEFIFSTKQSAMSLRNL